MIIQNYQMQPLKKLCPSANKAEAEICRRSFYFFLQTFWDVVVTEMPVFNWHMKYICDELQKETLRIKNRLPATNDIIIINVPPGCSKSTIVSQMWPVYNWIIDPSIKIMSGSNTKELSIRDSVTSRDIIRSLKFRLLFPELEIKGDEDGKGKYKNTAKGQRMTTSIGGTPIGEHAHIIIWDDPLNPKQEPTEASIQTSKESVDYSFTTRKIGKTAVGVLVMQRLNEDDPTGHLLKNKALRIKHICLPATVSDKVNPIELQEEYVNGLLDPIRIDRSDLAGKKAGLGSYGYAGQYDQTPSPAGGGLIKKVWFRHFDLMELINRAKDKGVSLVWNFTVDGAYTSDPSNDQCAILCYCIYDNHMYIRDCIAVWEELPEFKQTLYSFCTRNGYTSASSIYVEPKASGLPIVQTMKKETMLNVIIDKAPTADKVSRTKSCTPFMEAGRISLLHNGAFVESFLHQVTSFPAGKLKDKVDTLVMAIQRVNENKGGILAHGTN